MNRLVKAEAYRVLHSNRFMFWIVFMLLAAFGLSLTCVVTVGFSLTLDVALMSEEVPFQMMIMFIVVLVSVIVSLGYSRKTAYYEIMAGNKISNIIGSKVIVDALPISLLITVTMCIIPGIMGFKNGCGSFTDVPLRFFLIFVVMLHVSMVGLLISTAIRHLVAAVFAYLRIVLESLVYILVQVVILKEEKVFWFRENWFINSQISNLYAGEINAVLVCDIVGSFIFETVVLYLITYYGMKKKLYK